MDNNQNKQDNPKVEGAATYIETVYGTRNFAGALMLDDSQSIMDLMDDFSNYQTAPLHQRIAELEAFQKSDKKHIASLEKQVNWYVEIVDRHIKSPQNYTDEYIKNVIALNDKYREALEWISDEWYKGSQDKAPRNDIPLLNKIAEALNHKDKENG